MKSGSALPLSWRELHGAGEYAGAIFPGTGIKNEVLKRMMRIGPIGRIVGTGA